MISTVALPDCETTMKALLLCLAVLAVTATASAWAADRPAPPGPNPDVASVVQGDNAFAFDLYAKLRDQEGNLFCSPYSVSTALAMTYAGARNETASQMAKTLHLTLPPDNLHPSF